MGFSLRDSEQFTPFFLGPTAQATLQEFIDIDVRVQDLARILRGNKTYLQIFRNFVGQKVKEPAEEDPSPLRAPRPTPTRRLVGLLGMIGSRNLILSLRMNEVVRGEFPFNAEGILEIKPGDYLKLALQAEEFFARNQIQYGETAFAAGVLYDWINFVLKEKGHYPSLEPYFQETWKQAFRAGVIAFELAKRVPGQLPPHSLAATTLAPAGKLLLAAAVGPAYGELLAQAKANAKLDPLAKLLQERQAFGTSYEEVTAQALGYFSVFRGYGPVIRRFREPYLLKNDPAHEAQAHLILLAESAANLRSLPPAENDPSLLKLAPRSQRALKLSPAATLTALKAAAAYR